MTPQNRYLEFHLVTPVKLVLMWRKSSDSCLQMRSKEWLVQCFGGKCLGEAKGIRAHKSQGQVFKSSLSTARRERDDKYGTADR